MDMGTFIGVLWRRKLLTLLAIILALGAGATLAVRAGATYTYSSTVLLLPPDGARRQAEGKVDYTAGNPLFYLGSLDQARDILVSSLSSNDSQEALLARYPGNTFSVAPDVLSSSPVVVISASGADKESALGLVTTATEQVPTALSGIQANLKIPQDSQITSNVLVIDKDPVISHKGQIRSAIMATGGLGLVLLFAIGAIDALLRGRRSRQQDTGRVGIGLVTEKDPDDEPVASGRGKRSSSGEKSDEPASRLERRFTRK